MSQYIVLAEDTHAKDVLVFSIEGETPAGARSKIQSFYKNQDWEIETIGRIRVHKIDQKDVQLVGRALVDTEATQKKIRELYEILFHTGQMCEAAGDTATYDDILCYMRETQTGLEVIEAYENESAVPD